MRNAFSRGSPKLKAVSNFSVRISIFCVIFLTSTWYWRPWHSCSTYKSTVLDYSLILKWLTNLILFILNQTMLLLQNPFFLVTHLIHLFNHLLLSLIYGQLNLLKCGLYMIQTLVLCCVQSIQFRRNTFLCLCQLTLKKNYSKYMYTSMVLTFDIHSLALYNKISDILLMAMENGIMVCSQLFVLSLWDPPVHKVQNTVSQVSQKRSSWLMWTEHFGIT